MNLAIVPYAWLRDATENGYVYVDIDGDEEHPCRPLTIVERFPEWLRRKLFQRQRMPLEYHHHHHH
jgi:hypothetical protein